MTSLFMLDTDIVSYIVKGSSPALQGRLQRTPLVSICLSVMTQAELLCGLRRLAPEHRLQSAVRQYLERTQVLPWPPEAADQYAEIKHRLLRAGLSIGELDVMIAAHAIAADAVLVTNNLRHFERIGAPLRLESWARA